VAVSDASLRLDVPVMIAAVVVLLPIFWKGFVIQRWEGAVLVPPRGSKSRVRHAALRGSAA
jgi:Ca2+/Na+ antiporter